LNHQTLGELAQDREVRKASGFRAVAQALDAAGLASLYRRQIESAPRRGAAGKAYFAGHDGTLPKRGARHDADQLAIALVNHARQAGRPLPLPARLHGEDAGSVDLLDYHVPVKLVASEPPGVGRVDCLGLGPDERLAVVVLQYVAPSASRGSTGDTPLRALLEGLACCALLEADREALGAELKTAFGRSVSSEPPVLLLVGSPRYWELCRRREAQKGAAWINQMERLARVLEGSEEGEAPPEGEAVPALGIGVRYLGLVLEGEPAWEVRDERPTLLAPPRLATAWESTAGRIRPKPRPRAKSAPAEPQVVEADLSKPVRRYDLTTCYAAGERIDHPTLGRGVVQGVVGAMKIAVLFGGEKRVLVHDRPSPGAS